MILEERTNVGDKILYCEDQEIYRVEILERQEESSSLVFKMKVLAVKRTKRYEGVAIEEFVGSEISASKRIHSDFTYSGEWKFRHDLRL